MQRVRSEKVVDRERLVPPLLEADESEPVLRSYLNDGDLYRVLEGEDEIGAVLLIREGDALEIKNLALGEDRRGIGFGRATIEAVADLARASGLARLLVGTADSATGTIAFYRRVGFRDAGRIEGYFDAYPEPVIIDGVVAHDMVTFEMRL
jgi:ribosomal protein S18 acetylase RimI-like enzyme